jgi:hypothetical protein
MRVGDRAKDDSGAVAIVAALTLTVFILLAAFVVDLGTLRSDRIATKAVADLSTAAAVSLYEPGSVGGPLEACEAALRYADANLPGVGLLGATGSPSCAAAFDDGARCADLDAAGQTARYVAGAHELRITIPVPDGSELLGGLDHADYDGTPCERVGVELSRTSTAVFAGFVGGDEREILSASVGRANAGAGGEEYASLVILQPDGCQTIGTEGGNDLIDVVGTTIGDEYFPGTITVDTARCSAGGNSSARIFDPSSSGSPGIRATDGIFSNGLRLQSSGTIANARVLPTDAATTIDAGTTGGVVQGSPLTRSVIDDRYNCLASYPSDEWWSPTAWPRLSVPWGGVMTPICDASEEGTGSYPYLQRLHFAYQDMTLASALADLAWSVYPDDLPSSANAGCRNGGGDTTNHLLGPNTVFGAQQGSSTGHRWFINCGRAPNETHLQPQGLRFHEVDAVVSRGRVAAAGQFQVTGASGRGAVFYIQHGSLTGGNNANVELLRTFVYLDHKDAVVDTNSDRFVWQGPRRSEVGSGCAGYSGTGAPPAACFAPLSLWSNGDGLHRLRGGSTLVIGGSFFTPNAEVRMTGGSTNDLVDSQYFSSRLSVRGGSLLELVPNPETNVPTPARQLRVLLR